MSGPVPPALPDAETIHAMYMVKCITCAVLACVGWEWVLSISFEVDFMSKSSSNFSKVLYCISRYLGILSQVGNTFFIIRAQRLPPPPVAMCFRWFSSQISSGLVLVLGLQILLMARVYAMYNRSRRMAIAFTLLLVSKSAIQIFLVINASTKVVFVDEACVVGSIPSSVVAICSLEGATEILIIGITLWKYLHTMRSHRGQQVPLLQLILRDGLLTFSFVSTLFYIIIIDTEQGGELCRVIFPIGVAVISISTCRITKNLHQFPVVGVSDSETDVELTFVMTTTMSSISPR